MFKKRKGFALMEIVVYVAISALLLSGINIISGKVVEKIRHESTENIINTITYSFKDLLLSEGPIYLDSNAPTDENREIIENYLKEAELYYLNFVFDMESITFADKGFYIKTDMCDSYDSHFMIYMSTNDITNGSVIIISPGPDTVFDANDYTIDTCNDDIVKTVHANKLILD